MLMVYTWHVHVLMYMCMYNVISTLGLMCIRSAFYFFTPQLAGFGIQAPAGQCKLMNIAI